MWCLVPCSLHSYYFTVQQGHAASRAHSVFLLKYCWHRGWAQDLRLLFMTFSNKYVSAFLPCCWRMEAITESGRVHLTKALCPFMPYALHAGCRRSFLRNSSVSQEACSSNMMWMRFSLENAVQETRRLQWVVQLRTHYQQKIREKTHHAAEHEACVKCSKGTSC